MNKQQALQKLSTLPGGMFDEGQQLGVRIKFKGLGDIEALRQAIAADPWLLGTQLSRTHSFLNTQAKTARKETILTTFAALQAPKAIDILLANGFEIETVDANMIPQLRYSLVLMGHGGCQRGFLTNAMKDAMRKGQPIVAHCDSAEADTTFKLRPRPWTTMFYPPEEEAAK